MNIIMEKLWVWQARRKLDHKELILQYPAIHILGEHGNAKDYDNIIKFLGNQSTVIRNSAMHALKEMIVRNENEIDNYRHMIQEITHTFKAADSLVEKISAIEVMRVLPVSKREELLASMLVESEFDLQYQIIHSLSDTQNIEILDNVLIASNTNDLVLKRKALETWYKGLENQEFKKILDYCTEYLHHMIRATYELQLSGDFLKKVLSYAPPDKLPTPKAYPDFIIRYLTELIGNWEYDPEANRSIHAIVVPSYFTFDSTNNDENPPFIKL